MTLYELLTLTPIFPEAEPEPCWRKSRLKSRASCAKMAPWIPVDLETIVLKVMAKDQLERYATAEKLPTICDASSTINR